MTDTNPAPSISESLSEHGVPRHLHRQATRAFASWLSSWRGLGETADQLAAQAWAEGGGIR